jgi:hypothetical protein
MKSSVFCLFIICLFSCNNKSAETEGKQEQSDSPLSHDPVRQPDSTNTHDATYCNQRYGYCITYPDQVLKLEPEAPNGDGCVFNNLEGKEFLRVFGRTNPDPEAGNIDLNKEMAQEIISFLSDSSQSHARVSYSKAGKNFYVFSGKKDSSIYYQKAIKKGDDIAIAIFRYKKQQKAEYDVIVTTMAKSFH